MITECYIVSCENSIDANLLSEELYHNDVFTDLIDGNILILSKEWLDIQNFYKDKILNRISNISRRRNFKNPNIIIKKMNLITPQK